ncbi:MAG TPA: hypothetical protein VF983_13800 [Streptosporangiaceae bacterium]
MRHLIGTVLGVVMAGALFFAGAWGYLRLLRVAAPAFRLSQLPAGGGSLISDHSVLAGLIAVAGTGLLAGILVAAPRISPLAAGLPGLALLGLTGLYVVSVRHADSLIPLKSHSFGAGFEAMLFDGVLGAAGMVMIIPMFVPSRWRARDKLTESEVTEASEFVSSLTGTRKPQAPADPADDPEPVSALRTASYAAGPLHHGAPPSGRRSPSAD